MPSDGFLAELRRRNVFKGSALYLVVSWVILQVAELLLDALSLSEQWLRLILLLLVLGFPLLLIFSWVYEITPEGIKRERDIAPGESVNFLTGRRINLMILVLLLVSLLLYFFRPPDILPSRQQDVALSTEVGGSDNGPERLQVPDASIAVLPFADMSEKKNQEYFADGMAEEILNVLARVDGLKVASRTSSFAFKLQPEMGAPAIARDLGVKHILEGSVRMAGNTVRITVQLVDTEKDQHLWSNTFDRPLTTKNLFAIQDEVAAAVVTALRGKMGAQLGDALPAPVRTDDVDAYSLFLEARALFQARRDFILADSLLQEAIQIDPKFADALAIRAAIHLFGELYGANFGDVRTTREQAKEFARQALALDANNSFAIAVLAFTELFEHAGGLGERPFADILTGLDRALDLNPNNTNAVVWLGIAYEFAGLIEKAIDMQRRCIELDSTLALCRSHLALVLVINKKTTEASAVIDLAIDKGLYPLSPLSLFPLLELNRREAFLFLANAIPALRGWQKFNALYEAMRNPEKDHRELAAQLKALLVVNQAGPSFYSLLNAIGDYERPVNLPGLIWVDTMRPYRRSTQFKQHMRASGVVDYWREHGFPPLCRAVENDDFECD